MNSEDLKRLVADFNRDWPDVTRTRELLVLAEEFFCGGLIVAAVCANHLWRRPGERRDPYAEDSPVKDGADVLRNSDAGGYGSRRSPGRRFTYLSLLQFGEAVLFCYAALPCFLKNSAARRFSSGI
jgi:hypothetical protein